MAEEPPWRRESFSLYDLERLTGVIRSELLDFLDELGQNARPYARDWSVDRDGLEDLMAMLRPRLAAHGTKWPIPAELRDQGSPWAKALIEVYGQDISYPYSISPALGQILRDVVIIEKPEVVVEVGSLLGVSTMWAASALETIGGSGVVHVIDQGDPLTPAPPHHYGFVADPSSRARASIETAELQHRVVFHRASTQSIVKNSPDWVRGPVDLLLLDGDHSIAGVLFDFIRLSVGVPAGGVIMLHDTNEDASGVSGPRYLIDSVIRKLPDYDVFEFDRKDDDFGLTLIRKRM